MKIRFDFIKLFNQFISESQSGKRLQKNGKRISCGTIGMYKIVLDSIRKFISSKSFDLRIHNGNKLTSNEVKSEINYWKNFFRKYTDYLYANNNFDNYVGTHIKVLKTFFSYLKKEKGIPCGDFYTNFYVRKDSISVLALSRDNCSS